MIAVYFQLAERDPHKLLRISSSLIAATTVSKLPFLINLYSKIITMKNLFKKIFLYVYSLVYEDRYSEGYKYAMTEYANGQPLENISIQASNPFADHSFNYGVKCFCRDNGHLM